MAEDTNADDRDDLVDKIAEEFMARLRRKENPSTSELAKEHPELAPELEKRLKLVESIFRSTESEKTKASGIESASRVEKTQRGQSTIVSLSGNFAARIACPHCGNKVQLVGLQSNLVTCGSCGSSLKIVRPPVTELTEGVLPKRLGRFAIKRKLGAGSFGIVFLATDPELGRDVAIKTPRHGYFATMDEERRFFREAKHAASLQHPNIVQVFEVCDDEAAPLIVSEYIDGLTLNDIANQGLLTFKETSSLMIQVANAVEFAHQKGVVHRDLKPGNILLDKDRNAYITDFGLAFRDDAEITMTMDGAILGTPAYMSPEQAAGNQQLTGRRSDVYSLGVILYRLMTKELPFSGTKRMLVQQVINDDPKPPRSLNDRIPRDLESITLKAMSKSPDARYQTAGAMAEDLQRFLMGEPVLAQPISSFSKFTRWCARRPAIAALSGSIAALLLLCATISTLWAMNSNRLTKVANANARIATEHSRESSNRLHNFLMSNGVKELEQNNLTNSLLWFTDALALEDKPSDRIRLAMIQDRIPKLTQVVAGEGHCRNAFAEFSNDGSRVVSVSEKSVRIFETQSKRLLFEEPVSNWKRFSFAPDGTKFVVGVSDEEPGSIALWNVEQRRLIKKLTHAGLIQSVDFDSSGAKVVTGSMDSFAKIWNASDGSLVAQRSFEGFWVARVAFITGTTRVAVELNRAGDDAGKTVIWDYSQDVLVGKEILHESFVGHLSVSSDGKKICTGEKEGKIRVWEIDSGNQIGKTIDSMNHVRDAQFTANDSAVLALFSNGEIATFDFQNGKLESLITRTSKFNAFAQSPDSSIVALATTDGKAAFIWRASGIDVCTPINNGSGVTSIAFHPDGRRVALAGNEGAMLIWDLAGACPSSVLFADAGSVSSALFAQNSNRCLTTSGNGKGFIWDAKTGQRVGEGIEHLGAINCSSVSSDGKFFVTGGMDKLVKVWDCQSGKQVGKSFAHDELVTAVKISRDGSRIFSGDKNGTVRCWDVTATTIDEPRPVFELQQNSPLSSLLISPDDSMLTSASVDGRFRVWDAKTGKPVSPPLAHGKDQLTIRFMPDGKRIVSGGQQVEPIIVWDITTGDALQKLPNTSRVSDIQVLENGKRILIVNLEGTATTWIADDSGKYTVEKVFRLASNVLANDASFDTRHSLLALCGGMLTQKPGEQRGELNLWNLMDGRPLAPTIGSRTSIQRVAFSEDGQRLLTKSSDQSARVWSLNTTTLPATDLQRIARLHAQYVHNEDSALVRMDAATQQKELEALSAKYPSYFTVTEADRTIWEYELKQNSSNEQPQN